MCERRREGQVRRHSLFEVSIKSQEMLCNIAVIGTTAG
jgi:hypothetical protein